MIKLYAWEESFEKKVGKLREKEMMKLRTINMLQAVQTSLYEVVPLLVSVADSIVVFRALDNKVLDNHEKIIDGQCLSFELL